MTNSHGSELSNEARADRDNRLVRLGNEAPPVRRVAMALARRFFQICTTVAAESVAEADLTPLEFAVLAYLHKEGGEPDIDQRGLAERLGIDRNNTGLLVERLEAKGLLERRVDSGDRRARMLRLTVGGERLWQRLAPAAHAGQQKILAVLTPAEGETLLDLLVRVIEGNRELARPGTGRRKRRASARATRGRNHDAGSHPA